MGKWSDITEEIFNKRIAENELKGKVFAHGAKYGEKKSIFWKNADVLFSLLIITMNVSL